MRLTFNAPLCLLGVLALMALGPGRAGAESANALARRGNELLRQNRLEPAIEAYREALARQPDSPLYQYNLGTALAQDGRYDEAEEVLGGVSNLPGNRKEDALYNLGVMRAIEALKNAPALPELQELKALLPQTLKTKNGAELPGPSKPANLPGVIEKLESARKALRESILAGGDGPEVKKNFEIVDDVTKQLQEIQKQQQQQQQNQNQDQQNQQQSDQQNQQGQQGQQKQNQDQQNQQQSDQQNQQGQQGQQNQKPGDRQQPKPDDQQNPDQQPGQDSPDSQPPQDSSGDSPQNENEQQPSGGLEQSGETPQPVPSPSPPKPDPSAAEAGEDQAAEQSPTPEQMDARRLLNLLEKESPEQFKKLFRFRGSKGDDGQAGGDAAPRKEW